MRSKHILSMVALLCISSGSAQAQLSKQMREIKGSTRILGGGYQYELQEWRMHLLTPDVSFDQMNKQSVAIGELPGENNIRLQVTVADFFLSDQEVTNAEYRNFLLDSLLKGKDNEAFRRKLKTVAKDSKSLLAHWETLYPTAREKGLLPQLECWETDFPMAYNKPLVNNYFSHPAFDNYPVVGVSWVQANAFCKWMSAANNAARARKGLPPQPDFRLPTEMEWEYAALGSVSAPNSDDVASVQLFPWEGSSVQNAQGKYLANIKVGNGNYIGDNYEYTAPVRSFAANGFGLYDMAGNVSEWTMDSFTLRNREDLNELNPIRPTPGQYYGDAGLGPETLPPLRVIKGGSWADYQYASWCGSRAGMDENKGYSRVGFRVAMTKVSDEM